MSRQILNLRSSCERPRGKARGEAPVVVPVFEAKEEAEELVIELTPREGQSNRPKLVPREQANPLIQGQVGQYQGVTIFSTGMIGTEETLVVIGTAPTREDAKKLSQADALAREQAGIVLPARYVFMATTGAGDKWEVRAYFNQPPSMPIAPRWIAAAGAERYYRADRRKEDQYSDRWGRAIRALMGANDAITQQSYDPLAELAWSSAAKKKMAMKPQEAVSSILAQQQAREDLRAWMVKEIEAQSAAEMLDSIKAAEPSTATEAAISKKARRTRGSKKLLGSPPESIIIDDIDEPNKESPLSSDEVKAMKRWLSAGRADYVEAIDGLKEIRFIGVDPAVAEAERTGIFTPNPDMVQTGRAIRSLEQAAKKPPVTWVVDVEPKPPALPVKHERRVIQELTNCRRAAGG
jgi:hypothetical protein